MATHKTIIIAPMALDKSRLVDSKTMSSILQQQQQNYDSIQIKTRKRQRLDHLSAEEKMQRRKLKNRVAAQSARDRKKARMDDLEIDVQKLHNKMEKLLNEVGRLNCKNEKLEKENEELKKRLSSVDTSVNIKQEPLDTQSPCKDSLPKDSLEYAEGTGSVGSYSLDDAFRWLVDSEPDFMDVLQELAEQLEEPDEIFKDIDIKQTESSESKTTDRMVGTTTEQLESDRENIKSDHIYGKPCENVIIVSQNNCDEFVSEVILEEDGSITENPSIVDEQMDVSITITAPTSPPATLLLDDIIDITSPSFYTENDTKFTLDPRSPAISDSDYESSGSIYSPQSSLESPNSYLIEENHLWEESFQELFPSLL